MYLGAHSDAGLLIVGADAAPGRPYGSSNFRHIGDCCTKISLLRVPDGRFVLPKGTVMCNITLQNSTVLSFLAQDFIMPQNLRLCSCVNRTAVHDVHDTLVSYAQNNVSLTASVLVELKRRCAEAGSWIRHSDQDRGQDSVDADAEQPWPCRPAPRCGSGYYAYRMGSLRAVPCGNLSLM